MTPDHDPADTFVSSTSHDCVTAPFPDQCRICAEWERTVWLAERAAKTAQDDIDRRPA